MGQRSLLSTTLASALALAVFAATPAGAALAPTTRQGVARGTAVVARVNADNAIVPAVSAAAAKVQLGPVRAVGFSPDCSPSNGVVVVCRDPSVSRAAVPTRGPGWCVVGTDPRLGGGQPSIRVLTHALRACVTR